MYANINYNWIVMYISGSDARKIEWMLLKEI